MTQQKIGPALDALGLTVDLDDDAEITDAAVRLTVQYPDGRCIVRARTSHPHASGHTVPCTCEDRTVTVMHAGAVLDDEQTDRIKAWLEANDIDPRSIPTTKDIKIRYRNGHPMILISQYYEDENGHREYNYDANEPAMVQRTIIMYAPLPPQPEAGSTPPSKPTA